MSFHISYIQEGAHQSIRPHSYRYYNDSTFPFSLQMVFPKKRVIILTFFLSLYDHYDEF